jgi:polyvinyl alcohol dehydrogenase (cytochrome)
MLYAYNKTSHSLIWSVNIKSQYFPKLKATKVVCRTTPAFYGSSFLIGTYGPAYILKVDIATGTLLGKVVASSHVAAVVTMSGTVYDGKFFVGVSSTEESMAASATYVCCSFAGAFHAIDIQTMSILWTWTSVPANLIGPSQFSGNAIWGSSPAIDPDVGAVYLATGNNYKVSDELNDCYNSTAEADWEVSCNLVYAPLNWVESVVALDLHSGQLLWGRRLSEYDAWTVACLYGGGVGNPNCPSSPGPDSDFGMAPVISSRFGSKALFIGQKNGIAHCIDPANGQTIWATESCPGGILGGYSWGISVDDSRVYVSCINYGHLPWVLKNSTVVYGGGWAAMDKATGAVLWTTANPANFDPSGGPLDSSSNGRAATSWGSGPATAVGDIVLVTSGDSVYSPSLGSGGPVYGSGGYVYALKKSTGRILSSFETKAGVYGGFSVDSHCVYVGSGYTFLSAGKGVYGWCVPKS